VSIATRYTDCDIPAHLSDNKTIKHNNNTADMHICEVGVTLKPKILVAEMMNPTLFSFQCHGSNKQLELGT
jgi:hypothetical protein